MGLSPVVPERDSSCPGSSAVLSGDRQAPSLQHLTAHRALSRPPRIRPSGQRGQEVAAAPKAVQCGSDKVKAPLRARLPLGLHLLHAPLPHPTGPKLPTFPSPLQLTLGRLGTNLVSPKDL